MKATREAAVDFFIKECIDDGYVQLSEMMKEARRQEGIEPREVQELIKADKSQAYNIIHGSFAGGQCATCDAHLLHDSIEKEWYCPVCES